MPELPEVEVVRLMLENHLLSKTIKQVNIYYPKIVSGNNDFADRLIGQSVLALKRIGKYLIFELDDVILVSHLRMEGKYFLNKAVNKHTHLTITFDDDSILTYEDTRKFGRFELFDPTEFDLIKQKKLAKEPFNMASDELIKALKNKKIPIKEALLDQKIILGLGNIYANEVLFMAQIHPAKIASSISETEAKRIIKFSIEVFNQSIKLGGTTISSFEALSHIGSFQDFLKVHFREKQPCLTCGTLIKKVKLKGRGTYYCPQCQKAYVIALTGGIASGKSEAVKYLKRLGYQVIDSDKIVKELYQQPDVIDFVLHQFNFDLTQTDQFKRFSDEMFKNPQALAKLSEYLHPLVFDQIKKQRENIFTHLLFIDIPLLFETNYQAYDRSLLIYTTPDTQIERLMKRNNLTKEEAIKRINTQMPINDKISLADDTIDNIKTIDDLHAAIDQYLREF